MLNGQGLRRSLWSLGERLGRVVPRTVVGVAEARMGRSGRVRVGRRCRSRRWGLSM